MNAVSAYLEKTLREIVVQTKEIVLLIFKKRQSWYLVDRARNILCGKWNCVSTKLSITMFLPIFFSFFCGNNLAGAQTMGSNVTCAT